MKKLLLLWLGFLFLLPVWCYGFEVAGINYSFTGSNTVEVTKKTPLYIGNIVIPETIIYSGRTYFVRSISDSTFYNCTNLTAVNIPNNITYIGRCAFYGCTSITSITIPNGVSNIRDELFRNCYNLINVVLPSTVLAIERSAFAGCSKLASITVNNSMPPFCSVSDPFLNVDKTTCTLNVPFGCDSIYRQADVWKDFLNIKETGYLISVSAEPIAGGIVLGEKMYEKDDWATIEAIANTGYSFKYWKEDGKNVSQNSSYSFTVIKNRILTAIFLKQITITTTIKSPDITICSVSGSGIHDSNSIVTLQAIVNHPDYEFKHWEENGLFVSNQTNYSFHAKINRNLVAVFEKKKIYINTSVSPSSGGIIQGSDEYDIGSIVQLEAIPQTNYIFKGWQEAGAIVSTNSIYSFTATNNRTLVAIFSKLITISVTTELTNAGTLSGSGVFEEGSTVHLNATTNMGYKFLHWTDGVNIVSNQADYAFTANTDQTFTAVFMIHCIIQVNPSILDLRIGDTVYLEGNAFPKDIEFSLNWESMNSNIATVDNSGKIIALKEGNTNITATSQDGSCKGICNLTVIVPKNLMIYPNPFTNGEFTIELGQWLKELKETEDISVLLYNISGRLILDFPIGSDKTEIDISHLPNGTYIVRIGEFVRKITKQ